MAQSLRGRVASLAAGQVRYRFQVLIWALAVALALSVSGSAHAGTAQCGNGIVEAEEDCDLGGTCIGGAAAGMHCNVGDTTCTGGTCTTFGGEGCAANCTTEHDVPYVLVPGQLDGLNLVPKTSGVSIDSDFLSIPLPFGGMCSPVPDCSVVPVCLGQPCSADTDCPGGTCMPWQETLTVGKEKDGKIPVVMKASSVHYPGVPVSTLACGCIHGIPSKTCGGTFLESDGKTLSPDCTPLFSKCTTTACDTAGEPCAGKPPCAFVHGVGNTASGEIGCENGLDGINLSIEQDSGGSGGACAAPNTCPATVTLSGHGGPGSALVFRTLGIAVVLGPCTGNDPSTYGPDGVYCTADDPPGGIMAVAATSPAVTGTATAVVHKANGTEFTDIGPVTVTGAPFSCAALAQGSAAGAGLVQAFAFVHLDTVGDVVVTGQFFASTPVPPTPTLTPTPTGVIIGIGDFCEPDRICPPPLLCLIDPPHQARVCSCVGDCDGNAEVTVDELLAMVNVALGHTAVSACSLGDANSDGQIDISEILQAVNNALYGCAG
jgi:hypothetical protein